MDRHPDYSWLLKVFTKAANAATDPRFRIVDDAKRRTADPWGPILTPDARPNRRDRHILIQPDGEGFWEVQESDDGGATCWGELTKVEALAIGLEYVLKVGATLTLHHERPT
jgi:hypothetical protein